jgi:membrane associated rhomboid family serine protease
MFPLRDNVRSGRFPLVNWIFIAANLMVFLYEVQLERVGQLEPFIQTFGLVPERFLLDPTARLPEIFSSMFLHGSWGHVISNMWFLLIFGDNVEDAMGHARYFFFYLLMGFGAAAAQLAANPASQLPMVGASGAVAGILGAYFFLHPHARVLTLVVFVMFVRLVEIPAFFFLGIWFLTQTIAGVGTLSQQAVRGDMGGVAWWAHAGGFAAGFLFIHLFRRRR